MYIICNFTLPILKGTLKGKSLFPRNSVSERQHALPGPLWSLGKSSFPGKPACIWSPVQSSGPSAQGRDPQLHAANCCSLHPLGSETICLGARETRLPQMGADASPASPPAQEYGSVCRPLYLLHGSLEGVWIPIRLKQRTTDIYFFAGTETQFLKWNTLKLWNGHL